MAPTLRTHVAAEKQGVAGMSMFDQQPMGPVPARRSIMMPPDPELEALVADPVTVEVRIVGRSPRELAEAAVPALPRRRRWGRGAIALLLVLPMVFEIGWATLNLLVVGEDDDVRGPGIIVAFLVAATMLAAHAVWRHTRR